MKKKQRAKEQNMKEKREDLKAKKSAERQAEKLAYQFRERLIPLKKVKSNDD